MPYRASNLITRFNNVVLFSLLAMLSFCFSAVAVAQSTVSPTSVAFGNVALGIGATATVTLKNTGSASITIGSIAVTLGTPYSVDPGSTCLNITLPAGQICTVIVAFSPTAVLSSPATLTITNSSSVTLHTVSLSGAGVAPATVSATTLAFGNVAEGTPSAVKTITLTNVSTTTALTINSIAVPPGYAIDPSTTCLNPGTLAASSHCTIGVTVTPSVLGAVPAGSLTISTNNTVVQPATVALSGAGVAPATVSATTLAFGNVAEGTPSAVKTITLTNVSTTTALTINSIAVPPGYAIDPSTTCLNPGTLAASSHCTIGVTLTPAVLGALPAGSLTINTNNAVVQPPTVTLSGAGVAPATVSATTLAFGNVAEGTPSAVKTITLTDVSTTTALTINSIAVPPGYAIDPSTTCPNPGPLAASSHCTIGVTLTPASLGALPAGSLTINTNNAVVQPPTVTLSGAGVAPATVYATTLAFGNVAEGTPSAVKTITLTNVSTTTALTINSIAVPPGYAIDPSTTCPNPGPLAASSHCTIGVTLTPASLGALPAGSLTISTNNTVVQPATVALSGAGVAPATVSATTLAFGNVAEGTPSVVKTITLTNVSTTTALTINSIAVPPGYAIDPSTTCPNPGPLAASSHCTIGVTLTPASLGAVAVGSLTISTNASMNPAPVILSGAGVAPVTVSPTSLAFGNVAEQEPSAVKIITLTNVSTTTALAINAFSLPANYAIDPSTTCPNPGTLAAGAHCTIGVTLTPPVLGALPAGSLTISTNASLNPAPVPLTGTGILQVELSVSSLSFAAQLEGTSSVAKTVTVTNEQRLPLTIAAVSITGADPNDFALTTACPIAPSSLPPSPPVSACPVQVAFTPISAGTRTATLSVSDGALGSPQTVALSGTGTVPVTFSPTSITTFSAPVGTTSAYRTITITNANPNLGLHFNNLQLSGDFIQSATTCPMAPAVLGGAGTAASCTVNVEFDPSIGGTRDGQLQVYDDAFTSPQVVNLSGSGTTPLTLAPTYLSFSAQKLGTLSPAKNITLTNHESVQETFTLAPPANFTVTTGCQPGVTPGSWVIPPNGATCILSVVFAPGATATPGPLTGTLSIADTAPGGLPLTASLTGSGTTTNPAAAVAVVAPGAGSAGATVDVAITGNGLTHFAANSVVSFFETDSPTTPCAITATVLTSPPATANTINAQLVIGSSPVYGACNIKVVTPLAAGGSETALLGSAFIIADPNNAFTVTSVSPAFGTQGQTLNLDFTAVGMTYVQGTTFANFGDGISVNTLGPSGSPNGFEANITISNTTPVGYRTITLVTGGDFATSSSTGFQVGPNTAALLSASPTLTPVVPVVEPQGGSGQIFLTAFGTHFLQGATQVSVGGGVIVGAVQVTSQFTAVAQVAVPANASVGVQNVTVFDRRRNRDPGQQLHDHRRHSGHHLGGSQFRSAGPDAGCDHHRQRLYKLHGWPSAGRLYWRDHRQFNHPGAKQRGCQYHHKPIRQCRAHHRNTHQRRGGLRNPVPVHLHGQLRQRPNCERDAQQRSPGRPSDAHGRRFRNSLEPGNNDGGVLSSSTSVYHPQLR